VDLKRSGQNYKGLCPFHFGKNTLFHGKSLKADIPCFGCNKGGRYLSFIMNYENMTFSEALSFLANKAGVQIEVMRHDDPDKGIKEALFGNS